MDILPLLSLYAIIGLMLIIIIIAFVEKNSIKKDTMESEELPVISEEFPINKNNNIIRNRSLLIGISIILFIFLGNYHIVFNASSILISRPYFGFSDIIGDVRACTSTTWLVAMNNHPSLCKALQDSGDLESNKSMQNRVQSDLTDKVEQAKNCIAGCNIGSSNYSQCVENCY